MTGDSAFPSPRTGPGQPGEQSAEPVPAGFADDLPETVVRGALHEAMAEPALDRTPAPDELWRLEFDGTAALAVVLSVAGDDAIVVPAGEDPEMADPATLLLDEKETPLGIRCGVWVGLDADVPLFVFDRPLGPIDVLGEVEALREWVRGGGVGHPPTPRVGAPVTSAADPRARYRQALHQDLVALAETARLRQPDQPPRLSLGDALRQARVTPSTLAQTLGWDLDRARRAYEDALVASEETARYIVDRFELPEALVDAATYVPSELFVLLHRPRWRPEVRTWGSARDLPEPAARRRVAEEVIFGRQRSARAGEPQDWEAALEAFFRGAT